VHLFPRLARGGVLIIDDYGYFRGARAATDEFLASIENKLYLARVDDTVRVAVKIFD
jgi:O-methyltransferase